MATLYDVPAEDLIEAVAADLAERIDEPDWADLTKNGVHNEMPPQQEDFWHVRAASVLRKIATDGPVGVDRLATEYGGGKRGSNRYRVSPRKRSNGSKKVIRTICQQLEDEDLVKQAGSEGRTVTGEGRSLLDDTAGEVLQDLDRPDLERYA
jgi:small subunit ribosomal protein S19e